ncbi:MAG: peptidoglycan editing factor PgeF [Chromatiales bacterium]
MDDPEWILPDWPAPPGVRAVSTTRRGGCSTGPYASLNLALHVGDEPDRVRRNRALVRDRLGLPVEPFWLEQVHGCTVADAGGRAARADASFAEDGGAVCAVLTADCLPLLLCNREGNRVAAVHAGWRGLVAGVVERAVARFPDAPGHLLAWMGPAIGPGAFEVGEEVLGVFTEADPGCRGAFMPRGRGKWLADIFALARRRLAGLGIGFIGGGDCCTVSDPDRFFSFRRDATTGRMASLIWIERDPGDRR